MILSLLAMTQAVVVARFPEASRDEALVAELLRRPPGESSDLTAAALIAASGLTPWRGDDPAPVAMRNGLTIRARHAADGREVAVYYLDSADPPVVCRIRRSRGGVSTPHRRAIRWCADRLGVTLPPPVPPVS